MKKQVSERHAAGTRGEVPGPTTKTEQAEHLIVRLTPTEVSFKRAPAPDRVVIDGNELPGAVVTLVRYMRGQPVPMFSCSFYVEADGATEADLVDRMSKGTGTQLIVVQKGRVHSCRNGQLTSLAFDGAHVRVEVTGTSLFQQATA